MKSSNSVLALGALVLLAFIAVPRAQRNPIIFEQIDLPTAQDMQSTSLAIGPDGKLYAAQINGYISRFTIEPDGRLGPREVIASLPKAEGVERLLIGLTFDPGSTSANLIAWVSHTTFGFSDMPDWGGKISRLSGPDLEVVEEIVVGLPRSCRDHVTNGLAFGPDDALYFLQGSNSAMGAPDGIWCSRPERLLNAAVLRLDPTAVETPPLDVRTEEGGSYDPYAVGAPLTIHATGIRNAFDLLWHTNDELYVPVNGSAAGGNTPAGAPGASCEGGPYSGPDVPGLVNVSEQSDFLIRVEAEGYYGHPNPLRCEFVMNGGNPTQHKDPAEVGEYPVGTLPDSDFGGYAFDFGPHQSPNGVVEFRSPVFGGRMVRAILVARYSLGSDIIGLLPAAVEPRIARSKIGIPGFTDLAAPLDIVERVPDGYLYVSEFSAGRIKLLRPVDPQTPK